jgi:hypothetical protein
MTPYGEDLGFTVDGKTVTLVNAFGGPVIGPAHKPLTLKGS